MITASHTWEHQLLTHGEGVSCPRTPTGQNSSGNVVIVRKSLHFPPSLLHPSPTFPFFPGRRQSNERLQPFQPLPSPYLQSLAAPGLLLESERRVRERRNSIGDYSSEDKPGYSHLALAWQHGLQGGYIIFFFFFDSLQFNFNYSNLGEGTQEKPVRLCLGD